MEQSRRAFFGLLAAPVIRALLPAAPEPQFRALPVFPRHAFLRMDEGGEWVGIARALSMQPATWGVNHDGSTWGERPQFKPISRQVDISHVEKGGRA